MQETRDESIWCVRCRGGGERRDIVKRFELQGGLRSPEFLKHEVAGSEVDELVIM